MALAQPLTALCLSMTLPEHLLWPRHWSLGTIPGQTLPAPETVLAPWDYRVPEATTPLQVSPPVLRSRPCHLLACPQALCEVGAAPAVTGQSGGESQPRGGRHPTFCILRHLPPPGHTCLRTRCSLDESADPSRALLSPAGLATPSGPCQAGYFCAEGAASPTPRDGLTGAPCPPGTFCRECLRGPHSQPTSPSRLGDRPWGGG